MITETIDLGAGLPGTRQHLTVHRFGPRGARPRVYIQGALHADEIPGMIAAHHLVARLEELERGGLVRGEIVVVPVANPIGLTQRILGGAVGRFDLANGLNFNRGYAHLTPAVAARIEGRLTQDLDANERLIREAMVAEVEALPATSPADHLKSALLRLAVESDVVLDLHCDSEAVMHLYTLTPFADRIRPLGALLGAQAILLATISGDDPFDEASSRPWLELRERFPGYPIPLACFSATVELRGQADVSSDLARVDAEAMLAFLVVEGGLDGKLPLMPAEHCEPTPLVGSEPLIAPCPGMILFRKWPGDRIRAGDVVADIVDPVTRVVTPVQSASEGVLYARAAARFASAGQRLGKVAGTSIARAGKLLSP